MDSTNREDIKREIQDSQYQYPYHYIPTWEKGIFSQTQYWSWGFRYLGGIEIVLSQLKALTFHSLIDVGCGDGRLIREVSKRYPNLRSLGIDISRRAIQMAKTMNPENDFTVMDITRSSISERFHVATLVEVLEHIPPHRIPLCLNSIYRILEDGGFLVLLVPHTNKTPEAKHYQHFNSSNLQALLNPYFANLVFTPFDVRSMIMKKLAGFIGGSGNHYIITNARILAWFFRVYKKKYLYTHDEKRCLRIAVTCQKKP